jgi:cysteine desulfuration protein SufE
VTTPAPSPPSERLADLLGTLEELTDPADRASVLLSFAEQFREVPPEVASRPFDCANRVPHCESEAYVWAVEHPDGTLRLYFAVENPSGVSARALARILDRTLSGLPPERIAAVPDDLVERIFRQNISMGKGLGLRSMVLAVQALARAAAARQADAEASPPSRGGGQPTHS